MKIKLLFSSIALFALQSCQMGPCLNKESFLDHHKAIVDQTSKDWKDFDKKMWAEKDKELEQLNDQCYEKFEDQMTEEETKDYWVRNAKYQFRRNGEDWSKMISQGSNEIRDAINGELIPAMIDMKHELKEAFDEDFVNEIKDVFDEDFKNELKEIFDENFKNDLKDAFKELGEGLKEMGEEIKEAVEESK